MTWPIAASAPLLNEQARTERGNPIEREVAELALLDLGYLQAEALRVTRAYGPAQEKRRPEAAPTGAE